MPESSNHSLFFLENEGLSTVVRFPIYHALEKVLTKETPCIWRPNIAASRQGGSDTGGLGTWDSPLRTDSASSKSLQSFIQVT